MNTKSKLKAISIGIAAIMMVSLLAAVTTVSASPGVIVTDCEIGDDNKVYFTIHSDATGEGHMCLNINGEYRERKRYTLNAGETTTLSFREYRWNGVDDVEVCVDCVDTSCCTPIDPTPQPDLVVIDKWEEPVNGQVIVHFTIENIGGADAGSSTACMEINDVLKDTVSVPALAVGESDVGAFDPEPCPPDTTIKVTVCADNDDDVDESDETNNCMTNDFTCPKKPDLDVVEKWETLNVDGQVIVHFIIENIGDADAGESYATLYIDNMVVETQNVLVEALGPNGRFVSEFAAEDCTPGTITVKVCADDTHMVDESDENNNCELNYFTCPPAKEPDLDVVEKWETLNVDGQVIVHFIIKNIGDADAGESYATLYIDDMVVETQNVLVEALGPNGRFVSEFAAEDCTPGTITVKVCADDTHMVDESDENNNCELNYFTCPPAKEPDLDVIKMWEEPVRADGPVIVHFIIENIGDADAGESYATLYIDDMDEEIQNVPVPELGPNGRFVSEFAAEDCTPGTAITVKVCADDTHMVEESDENNNCEQHQYTPTWLEPDLIVFSKSEEPTVDGQVIVHFVIQNVGDADAVSSTASLEINGVMIDTASVPVLQPGISYGGAFAAQDCPPLTTITIAVCADNDDVVDESDETNNCMVNPYTCLIRPKPDLVVDNKWEEPVDGQVIVHFEIHNNGTVKAGESYATLYIDDMSVKIQNVYVPEVGPSGVFSGEFAPEDCTPGTAITVRVCADDTHMVNESSETNNCETNVYTCEAKPDLVVIEKWEEPEYTCCGLWNVIVHFVVQNIGGADAGPSIACKKVNGVLMDTDDVPALAAGESYASAFDPEPCPPGETINFTVCADNYDAVDESNENNNCMTNNYTCPAKPDLVVIDKWEEPVNGQVIVHFVIQNNATVKAGESYATLYIDDMDLKIQNVLVPEVGPSGTFSGEFVAEPCTPNRTITVRVCADDTNMVDESNETNNCRTNNYTCPGPDLVVIEMSEESIRADGHVIVHFIIQNNGTADAGESHATLYIDDMDVEIQNVLVPELGPNGRYVSAFAPVRCPTNETITVKVCADDTHVVDESNETNNCKTNYFTCPSQGPDLVIEKTVDITRLGPNMCRYRVNYTMTNIGNVTADYFGVWPGNTVVLFVDGTLERTRWLIPALGPGANWSGTFLWQACCDGTINDTINFTVCADHYNVVDESNENNNCEINIEDCGIEGDITVTKTASKTTGIQLGDIVTFTGTVEYDTNCCCCDLTDIYVKDTLPACFKYVPGSGSPALDHVKIVPGGLEIYWHTDKMTCDTTKTYTIGAKLVDCCYDVPNAVPQATNIITANATTCRDNLVTGSATVTVYPDTEIGMDITKKVLNTSSGQWEDSITVANGTDVTFRCTVHNNGTCRDLYLIQVWDAMSDSLEYNRQNNTPYNVTPVDVEPSAATTLYWEFGPIVLEPCEWLNFTVNATVNATQGEVDTNTLRVRAWSLKWWTMPWSWEPIFRTVEVEVKSSG